MEEETQTEDLQDAKDLDDSQDSNDPKGPGDSNDSKDPKAPEAAKEPEPTPAEPAEPDWKDRYARAMADFDNFRKRTARDREDLVKFAASDVLKDMLPTVDNLSRALDGAKDKADDPFVAGVKLVYDGLLKALADHGATPLDAAGEPFDSSRTDLFGTLLERLARERFPDRPDPNDTEAAFATFAFFESYFSNFIEGTEFELEEARRIVETGVAVPARDADSHDILGTYAVVSNRREMSRRAATADEFLDILRERHRIVLAGRPSSAPGRFKTRDNRAGDTHFVSVDRVRGTLRRGFEMSRAIAHPFARAVFVLFVVSEVHPFADGNGRLSRIMMNAELAAAGQAKILVPTVFRPDYLGALRRLSRKGDPAPLVASMARLWVFGRLLDGSDFESMRRRLEAANAFSDDNSAILRF